mgnify:CR=1 FL=1
METELTTIISKAEAYEKELPALPEIAPISSDLAGYIDHTLLKPEAAPDQIVQYCLEAREYGFASVCVNGIYVPIVNRVLTGSKVKVDAVVGFPLGAMSTRAKAAETKACIEDGAVEIDMVLPIGLLRAGEFAAVLDDIRGIVDVCHPHKAELKVIIETSLLDKKQKIIACLLSQAAGADFVKTSTGFSTGGATIEDVDLMRRVVGSAKVTKVKASGGIRSLADARKMLAAGADRLGTSGGIKIIEEYKAETKAE